MVSAREVAEGFTWLVPDRLAACRYPSSDVAYRWLQAAGISLVVSLHPEPHDDAILARFGLRQVHLPVTDFTAPSREQLEQGVEAIAASVADGRSTVVHCAFGLGRTGTLVACYLTTTGLTADEAIERVRRLRPGLVETDEQVEAVRRFAGRRVSP